MKFAPAIRPVEKRVPHWRLRSVRSVFWLLRIALPFRIFRDQMVSASNRGRTLRKLAGRNDRKLLQKSLGADALVPRPEAFESHPSQAFEHPETANRAFLFQWPLR